MALKNMKKQKAHVRKLHSKNTIQYNSVKEFFEPESSVGIGKKPTIIGRIRSFFRIEK
jgi:hypothetical protein